MTTSREERPHGDGPAPLVPGPPERCPACGAGGLEAVSDGERTNFFCHSCARCWHMELNVMTRVDVKTCPGCEHLTTCRLRALVADTTGV